MKTVLEIVRLALIINAPQNRILVQNTVTAKRQNIATNVNVKKSPANIRPNVLRVQSVALSMGKRFVKADNAARSMENVSKTEHCQWFVMMDLVQQGVRKTFNVTRIQNVTFATRRLESVKRILIRNVAKSQKIASPRRFAKTTFACPKLANI